ncbi:hypothetical protein ACW9I5_28895 [Pseudomonas azotoformans]
MTDVIDLIGSLNSQHAAPEYRTQFFQNADELPIKPLNQRTNACPGKILIINGITGALGLGAVALTLALCVKKILGAARNKDLFQKVQGIGPPRRIEILESDSDSVKEWSQRVTDGEGIDIVLAMASTAPVEALVESFKSLNRGGRLVDIGAVQGAFK